MKPFFKENLQKFIPGGVLFILSLAFFFPVIFQGKTFYAFDCLFHYLPWSSFSSPDFRAYNTLITDPIHAFYFSLFYPAHHHYQSSVADGTLYLWFGLNFCGVPFTFYSYPFLYFFYTLFPLTTAHDLLLFFHLMGTGIFTYLYLREIGLKPLSSLVGSIAWMFNGYVAVWFEFEHLPMMAVTISAALYFIEVWWKKRSALSFIFLTGSIALSICVSLAHILVYQLIFIGIYLLYRCISAKVENRSAWKHSFKPLWGAIFAILLSFAVSANFFTTHLMIYKDNQRKPIPYSDLFNETGQVMPKYLTTLLFPDFFGSPAMGISFIPKAHPHQAYNNYNELCLYPGIMTLFLALVCLPYLGKKQYLSLFMITAMSSLTMAMGSILYYPLAKFVPGLNLSTPTRILYLFGFSISILAAMGADILQNEENKPKTLIIVLWGLLLILALMIVSFIRTEAGIKWAADWRIQQSNWKYYSELIQSHLDISSVVILKPMLIIFSAFLILSAMLYSPSKAQKTLLLRISIVLLSYDLISFGQFYNTASPRNMEYPSTPAIRFLQKDKSKFRIITFGNFLQHSFVPFGIEDLSGYGSFYPRRYGEFLHLSQKGPGVPFPDQFSRWITFSKFGSPLLDLVNTKYVLVPPSTDLKSEQLRLVYKGEINIYENISAFPRIFFVPKYHLADNEQDAYHILGKFSRQDFLHTVILESPPPSGFTADNNDSGSESKIKLTAYTPNRIESEIESNINGFMVIGDNFHSGWEATVDGKQTDILRANYIMRAIPVTKGKHTVVLTFRPKLLIAGMLITAAGWIILFAAILVCLFRKKHTDAGMLRSDRSTRQ